MVFRARRLVDFLTQAVVDLSCGFGYIDILQMSWTIQRNAKLALDTSRTVGHYHHTISDTMDKISAKSLQIVGDVAVTLVK